MAELIARSADLRLQSEILRITEQPDGVQIATAGESFHAKTLIACAGLQSDRLAELAGIAIDHRIVPFRGEYYRLPASRAGLINHLIYPVPDPDLPFLGIHLTKMIDGSITLGPNAVLGFAREGYAKLSFDAKDVADYLGFGGFWKVMAKNLSSGVTEMRNSLWRRGYLAECRKYCPSLDLDDLQPHEAGIRAQAVMRDGSLVHDFLLLETDRMLHVCNAPSPAATSAIPIGRMIAEKILAKHNLTAAA
jgi:L-2-hydroxyglutarate oxidase